MSQKVIAVGNSAGVILPKPLGFLPGQEIEVLQEGADRVVIERKRKSPRKGSGELVRWAANYVERYRKDFEALANT